MTTILLCFNLGSPLSEQTRQLSFWLDFLNSSLSLPALPPPGTIPKWSITLVGVRADEQTEFDLTNNPRAISVWKKRYPRLPISPAVFSVSSLSSTESVQTLLQFATEECSRIFDQHTVQIPSTYHQFLQKLKQIGKDNPVVHWTELHKMVDPEAHQDLESFKFMLQYCQSIGRVVWLPSGSVYTDPTMAPKIAAKFVSPRAVRLELLKRESERVEILDGTEVGCLLDIDVSESSRYHFLLFFGYINFGITISDQTHFLQIVTGP
jgi:hypothetical protein